MRLNMSVNIGDAYTYAVIGLCVFIALVLLVINFVKYYMKFFALSFKLKNIALTFIRDKVGVHLSIIDVFFTRKARLTKGSMLYKIYAFMYKLLVDLNLTKDGVTVSGLIVMLSVLSLGLDFLLNAWLDLGVLFIIGFITSFIVLIILLKYVSVTAAEQRNSRIMDAVDLLSSDVKGGILNTMRRYKDSIHPDIRIYFDIFFENLDKRAYSFREAMLKLNDDLGITFSAFAQKAIMYNEKSDETMDEIFTPLIIDNSTRRTLQADNKRIFAQRKAYFFVCLVIILAYALVMFFTDSYTHTFFTTLMFGKLVLLADILLIIGAIGILTVLITKPL